MEGQGDIKRRNFLKKTVLVAVAVSVSGLKACKEDDNTDPIRNDCVTTKDILGPFYKAGAPYQENIIPPENTAAPLYILGKVSGNCNPVKDARVEIGKPYGRIYDTSDGIS